MILLLAALLTTVDVVTVDVPQLCSLRNPNGDKIEFVAASDADGWSITPRASSVWPTVSMRASRQTVRTSGASKGEAVFFGDAKKGLSLRMVPVGPATQLATIYSLESAKSKLPVAVGFCGPSSADAASVKPVEGGVPLSADSAVSPAGWRDSTCALVSVTGRGGLIDYKPFDEGRATFASVGGWPWKRKITVDRGSSRVTTERTRVTRLGGRNTLGATEYFYIKGSTAAILILFDRMAKSSGPDEPAAALCGYPGVTRAIEIR